MPRTRYSGGVPIGAKQLCRIATGSYTGDGSTSHAITGIGFRPRYLWIHIDSFVDGAERSAWVRMDLFTANFAWVPVNAGGHNTLSDRIISLDADGFTVDDDGSDADPNKNLQGYIFVAWG